MRSVSSPPSSSATISSWCVNDRRTNGTVGYGSFPVANSNMANLTVLQYVESYSRSWESKQNPMARQSLQSRTQTRLT